MIVGLLSRQYCPTSFLVWLRLYQVAGAATTRFAYDGLDRIAEYDGGNALQRRYVFGAGVDAPIVWYEGSGTGDRRFLSSDERGSIVSVTDGSGAVLAVNRYDEYGIPQAGNLGVWGYTGQAWLPELGMQYSKARIYSPTLGRFLQTDPIGYGDGPNWYNYVGSDPVNATDPSGLLKLNPCKQDAQGDEIIACAWVVPTGNFGSVLRVGNSLAITSWEILNLTEQEKSDSQEDEIVVTARSRHRYTIGRRLTRPGTNCTAAQVSGAVNRNIVPGSYGNHTSGKSYRVYAPGGFYSPGTITFFSNASGTQFRNVTNSDHLLCCGSVTTTISGSSARGFTVSVLGTGSNTSAFIADVNQHVGPEIFSDQVDAAAEELEQICGG